MGYFVCFLLQLSTLLTMWRFYVWAKREEARADKLEARLLAGAKTSWGGDDAE